MKDKHIEYKTSTESVSIAEAKSSFSEYVSRVAYAGESILITKRGKPVAGLVSYKELEKLKKIKKSDGLKSLIGKCKESESFTDVIDEVYKNREKDIMKAADMDRKRDVSF
ncbi:MAG: type II toxin-antitoxin system Phd/YefM family antitoxin [Candidatus Humimicrobiaceae bacterium]